MAPARAQRWCTGDPNYPSRMCFKILPTTRIKKPVAKLRFVARRKGATPQQVVHQKLFGPGTDFPQTDH